MDLLSLQGGGCLGMGQVTILTALENQAKKPIYQLFDIIAGTSVGCIIGSCLSIGIPAKDITSFFTIDAPKIFSKSWFNSVSTLWGAKYGASTIEAALQNRLKDSTLKDCKTRFIATAYDWASDRPVYFKSYEKSYSTNNYIVIGYDSDIKLWQIARASSAAQTYFPGFSYNNMSLLDGGNSGDNNPDMLIISESIKYEKIDNIKLLSIGAGDTLWKENSNSMINPSIARAGLETIKIVFSAGESAEVYKAYKILGNNYNRISPDLGDGYNIDDASNNTLNALQNAATKAIIINKDILDKFSQ